MEHLESLLLAQEKEEKKNPKAAKVTRKFIVAEGIYTNTGEIAPVDVLVKFKVFFHRVVKYPSSNCKTIRTWLGYLKI